MSSDDGDDSDRGRSDEVIALHPADSGMQLGRALLHALHNAGISVLYQDRELKTVWARNMQAPWAAGGNSETLPPAQAERIAAAKREVIASGNPQRLDIGAYDHDGMRWFDVWVDADRGPDNTVQGVVTTMVETTEQRRREQTLKTLLREVSHRSKNLLAIIQSIATQTGRYSDTLADFLTRFRGRLHSLASSQDLVTSSNWRGAALRELVAGQVGRYMPDMARTLRFSGENPYLNPNAALHIGLAMHELAVNSVSYGALSKPGGFIEVQALLRGTAGEDRSMVLTWSESIDLAERDVGARRFGSVALERVVPAAVNGEASLEIAGERLTYRLSVPHGNFASD